MTIRATSAVIPEAENGDLGSEYNELLRLSPPPEMQPPKQPPSLPPPLATIPKTTGTRGAGQLKQS